MAAWPPMPEHARRTTASASMALFVVLVVQAPAGAGKTLGWVRSITRPRVRRRAVLVRSAVLHVIMSAPTFNLLNQTAFELDRHGLGSPVVTVIHNEMRVAIALKGVAPAIRAYYDRVSPT
jgi:hypothetical protein